MKPKRDASETPAQENPELASLSSEQAELDEDSEIAEVGEGVESHEDSRSLLTSELASDAT